MNKTFNETCNVTILRPINLNFIVNKLYLLKYETTERKYHGSVNCKLIKHRIHQRYFVKDFQAICHVRQSRIFTFESCSKFGKMSTRHRSAESIFHLHRNKSIPLYPLLDFFLKFMVFKILTSPLNIFSKMSRYPRMHFVHFPLDSHRRSLESLGLVILGGHRFF